MTEILLEGEPMTHVIRISATALVLMITLVAAAALADDSKEGANPENKLIGTWKCISAKYGGTEANRPAGYTQLKHVTPTQFMWAFYDSDGKVGASLGGRYTLQGDDYVETPEYGLGDVLDQLKGKTQSLKWKVEGNKWCHNGKLSSGLTIEEVWERVEK